MAGGRRIRVFGSVLLLAGGSHWAHSPSFPGPGAGHSSRWFKVNVTLAQRAGARRKEESSGQLESELPGEHTARDPSRALAAAAAALACERLQPPLRALRWARAGTQGPGLSGLGSDSVLYFWARPRNEPANEPANDFWARPRNEWRQ